MASKPYLLTYSFRPGVKASKPFLLAFGPDPSNELDTFLLHVSMSSKPLKLWMSIIELILLQVPF